MDWILCLFDACAEPRGLANAGLVLDMIGAVLIAATAWMRLKIPGKAGVTMAGGITFTGANKEVRRTLWWRRALVVIGGILLVVGFYFQIHANQLQMVGS